jgi:hypothetical protein
MELVVPISADGANILDSSRFGRFILTSSYDKYEHYFDGATYTLWDKKSKRQLKTWVAEKSGFTYNENEIWVYKDSILEVINFQNNSVVALKKGNIRHFEFLDSKPQAVINLDDKLQLWEYNTNKTLKNWEGFFQEEFELTKDDESLFFYSGDSLFLKPLIDGSEYIERGWFVPMLRELEYNADGDFVIIIYGENYSFQDSTIIDNTACAEYINLKSGDQHQFQIPDGWYFSFVQFSKDGFKILLTPRFDGSYLFDIKTKKMIGQFGQSPGNGTTSFYDHDKIVHYEEDLIQIWEIDPLQIIEEKCVELDNTLREKTLLQYGIKPKEEPLKTRGDSFIADRIITNEKGDRSVFIDYNIYGFSSVIVWDQKNVKILFTQVSHYYIIDAIFTDNDSKLILIDNHLYAEVWDVLEGKKISSFKLFHFQNDKFYTSFFPNEHRDNLFFNFEMRSWFKKKERFYYQLEEFEDSNEEKIDSIWFQLKFDYSTNGKNQMLFFYEVFQVDPEGVKKDESGTNSIYPVFSLKNNSVSVFDINTGERIQSFEENGLEINPLGFSTNEEYILLDTKKNYNRIRISLFKGEEWFPEELLDSKTISLDEFIEKEKIIIEDLLNDIGYDEVISIEETYEIGSFLKTNKINLDSLLEKKGLQRNVDYQIYNAKYDSYDQAWIIGKIDLKRKSIDFYLVKEDDDQKNKIFLKRLNFIEFLESHNRYSNVYYEYIQDFCQDPVKGPENINEFLKKYKISYDHFFQSQDSLFFLQIEPLFKNQSYRDYWSIKSGERCFYSPGLMKYYSPDTIVNVFSYEQMKEGLRIRNKQNNGDSLTLFLFDNDPFLLHSSGYFMGSKNSSKQLHYLGKDLKIVSFDQLDFIYNRPDIVLQKAGCLDTLLIDSYRKAHEKRIRRLGVDQQLYKGTYSVPTMVISNFESELEKKNVEYYSIQIHGFDSLYFFDNYNIYINEIPIYGKNGYSMRNSKVNSIDTTILIQLSEGENRIEVSATNSEGIQSFRSPLYLTYFPEKPYTPKTHFIGIGIDQFKEEGHDLSYSVKDVRDLAKAMKAKLGDQLTIDTLFNQNVSISNVQALKKRLLETNINDKVIISYSGHGLLSKEYDYYLSSYTVNFQQPEIGGIPYEVLEDLLDSIPARHKLLLIDACHSGEVDKDDFREMAAVAGAKGIVQPKGGDAENTSASNTVGLQNSFQLMQELFVNVQKGSGATIISAAAGDQFALEGGKLENGFFTYAILQYIANNQSVAINELKRYVYAEVERLSGGLQKPTSRIENLELDWRMW